MSKHKNSAMGSSNVVLSAHQLCKAYGEGAQTLQVLDNISLSIQKGERVAIIGSSGSGKSTLLHMLGGLDAPTNGRVILFDQNLAEMNESQRSEMRNQSLGFVYQFHHLLAEFNALDNVAMPLLIRRIPRAQAQTQALDMLKQVGLESRAHHLPSELSGGERQRVAIARALVTQPACVLADEPTGNLDTKIAEQIFALMMTLSKTMNTAFVIVTHDHDLAKRCDRVLKVSSKGLSEIVLE